MNRTLQHPSEAELLAFNQGELDETVLDAVSIHVQDCSACCTRLRALESSDRVLPWLRRTATPTPAAPSQPADPAATHTPVDRLQKDTQDTGATEAYSYVSGTLDLAELFHSPQ